MTDLFLTCPELFCLFVSLTLENPMLCFIQWAPKLGESGWIYTQLGVGGSGLPPETHSPLTYFQRLPPTQTKSSRKEYIALGSSPVTFTLSTGNIRLRGKVVDKCQNKLRLYSLVKSLVNVMSCKSIVPAILSHNHLVRQGFKSPP